MEQDEKIPQDSLEKIVGDKEERKLRARRENKSVWAGLGLFGMIGWSIALPLIAGAALGIWLDKIYKQSFSWTLTLLITGLLVGCVLAWKWVQKENKEIHKQETDEHE